MFERQRKYICSFFRSDWTLKDYPMRIRHQVPDLEHQPPNPNWAPIPWSADIINWWWMFGRGDTREEALGDLERRFREFKEKGERLPRPSTEVPLKLAPSQRVERHADIAGEFLEAVLGFGPKDPVLITDESSLYDFEYSDEELTIEVMIERIRDTFGIELAGDSDEYLLGEIFARIAELRTNQSDPESSSG